MSANSFISENITYLSVPIISKSQSADTGGNLIKSRGPEEEDLAEFLGNIFDKLGTAHTFYLLVESWVYRLNIKVGTNELSGKGRLISCL